MTIDLATPAFPRLQEARGDYMDHGSEDISTNPE